MTTKQRLLLLTMWLAGFGSAYAQGTAFTYQGRLTDGSSSATGLYDFKCRIFDAATAGLPVGLTISRDGVAVVNGLFTVSLDFGPDVFTGGPRFLELAVKASGAAAFTILAPRQELTPSPYAIYAGTAGRAAAVNWTDILGIPPGFADGVDDDRIYSAGAGLTLSESGEFQVSFGGSGTVNAAARIDHDHVGADWSGSIPTGYVLGLFNDGVDGVGIHAQANARDGRGAGVEGESNAENGSGVAGYANGTGSGKRGVYGRVEGAGYGVTGFHSARTETGAGVYGYTTSADGTAAGVLGVSAGLGSLDAGVRGVNEGLGAGVEGTSEVGAGVSGRGRVGVLGLATPAGTAVSALGAGPASTALSISNGAIRVVQAGVGSTAPVFIHRATDANTALGSHITRIDHPLTDGDPNAILIVTHNYSRDIATDRYEAHAVGVFYDGDHWNIYHEDYTVPMPMGRAFNVMIIKP